jgi:hypothetical protein
MTETLTTTTYLVALPSGGRAVVYAQTDFGSVLIVLLLTVLVGLSIVGVVKLWLFSLRVSQLLHSLRSLSTSWQTWAQDFGEHYGRDVE